MKFGSAETLLLAILVSAGLSACKTEEPNESLPYEEKIVISGAIEPDHLIYLRLTRTLPPLTGEVAGDELVNPKPSVTISSGDSSWTLAPDIYDPKVFMNDQIHFAPGKTYTLDVRWKSLHAYASTKIPNPVEIKYLKYRMIINKRGAGRYDTLYDYKVYFRPTVDAFYQSGYILENFFWYYSKYNELINGKSVDEEGLASLNFFSSPVSDTPKSVSDHLTIFVDSFDAPYEKFFLSRNEGDNPDDIFGISGVNVGGNVQGDGIGIFIGKYRTTIPAREVIK